MINNTICELPLTETITECGGALFTNLVGFHVIASLLFLFVGLIAFSSSKGRAKFAWVWLFVTVVNTLIVIGLLIKPELITNALEFIKNFITGLSNNI